MACKIGHIIRLGIFYKIDSHGEDGYINVLRVVDY